MLQDSQKTSISKASVAPPLVTVCEAGTYNTSPASSKRGRIFQIFKAPSKQLKTGLFKEVKPTMPEKRDLTLKAPPQELKNVVITGVKPVAMKKTKTPW